MRRALPGYTGISGACDDGSPFMAVVGKYQPNAFGLYDMSGNAWEWVEDCYAPTLETIPADGRPRLEGDCTFHDDRGGSFDDDPWDLRSATRHKVVPAERRNDLGFRVARTLRAS